MKIEIIRQIASHDIQHLLREPRFPIFKGFTTSYILSLCLIASAYTLQISVRLYSFLCSFQKYTISNLKLHYLNNYSPINLISSGLFLDSSIHSSRLTVPPWQLSTPHIAHLLSLTNQIHKGKEQYQIQISTAISSLDQSVHLHTLQEPRPGSQFSLPMFPFSCRDASAVKLSWKFRLSYRI